MKGTLNGSPTGKLGTESPSYNSVDRLALWTSSDYSTSLLPASRSERPSVKSESAKMKVEPIET